MAGHERNVKPLDPEQPFLFFKIGVLDCAPLDFMKKLAHEYDADYVSSDQIRLEKMHEKDKKRELNGLSPKKRHNIDIGRIKRTVSVEATGVLSEGDDVVIDMFYNTPNSRREVREIARVTGAAAVALWVNTPFEVALERVREWTEDDAFTVPVDRWDIAPEQAARTMMNHVEWPDHEGIDYVVNLSGEDDTQGMLDQFDDWLERTGIAARYDD